MTTTRVGTGPDAPRLMRRLRALTPAWRVSRREAQWIAEQQARLLLSAAGITAPPVPDWIVTELEGVNIYLLDRMPVKGLLGVSRPNRDGGTILIDCSLPRPERRVTLMHELKHVIDGGHATKLRQRGSQSSSEGLCTDFALSVLMPASWLRADWQAGNRSVGALAERYQVPAEAVAHRLHSLELRQHPKPPLPHSCCYWQPHQPVTRSTTNGNHERKET